MRATINRVGKYELKAVLARTALSTVYDGWDSDIARRVAIKTMPLSTADDDEAREALDRFKRGAQAAGRLNHPNIVAVYDYGETKDFAYLVMEFIDGPTLKALFDQDHRFSATDICNIVGGILDALQYSHDRRVIHRDMKPANVMFTLNHVVKITDFGIARLEDSEMTQVGTQIGTPAYMSPEQFLGEKVDWRTDIYSTGVLLYHILTGERPYEGTLATIMHKVLYGTPLLPSRLSTVVTPALDKVVTRAMARKPEDRFESCTEFKVALLEALTPTGTKPAGPKPAAAKPTLAIPPRAEPRRPLPQRAAARSKRTLPDVVSRPLILASLAAVVVVGSGATLWHLYSRPAALTVPDEPALTEKVAAPQTEVLETRNEPPPAPNAQLPPPEMNNQGSNPTAFATVPEPSPPPTTADQRGSASAYQDSAPVPPPVARYEPKRAAPEYSEPHKYAATNDPVYAPPLRNPPPEKKLPLPPPVANLATKAPPNDRFLVPPAADRRAPPTDGKSSKPLQEQASRASPPNEPPGDDSLANVLGRLKEPGPEPSAPIDPATLYPTTSINGQVGLVCQTVTVETAEKFGLGGARGMVVTGVTAGSPAATAGIQPQDVILRINGHEVRDLNNLATIVKEGTDKRTARVELFRKGTQRVVLLEVDRIRR